MSVTGYPLEPKNVYVGLECMAKFVNFDPEWNQFYVPIRIIQKYPKFWVATVLPHYNQSENGCPLSKPYNVTIKRHELKCGDVVLKERR